MFYLVYLPEKVCKNFPIKNLQMLGHSMNDKEREVIYRVSG